ncbi:HTTM domain-containing protein [Pedobacter punctiformis]|uniref:HTTM domain-containing protein n=1 Tax=Pedobacter punctiformis TaxID=3004097 RepID=A0ABT4L8U8_9SPHI|nr:HTTM domain-containing protein [Pedobacter sp. HCMS5-2]MCZ4244350.1 HTTM domain-containing protein [Pedobacter sp. HCMS5-2]
MNIISKVNKGLDHFLFKPNGTNIFAFFRVAVSIHCIVFVVSIYSEMHKFFGLSGFSNREVTETFIRLKYIPRLSWFHDVFGSWFNTDEQMLHAVLLIHLFFLITLLLGLFTRVSALITLFIHLCIVQSNTFFLYGMDYFTTISLFFCTFMPVSDFSLDQSLLKKKIASPEFRNFCIRFIQVQMCFIYFFGGFHKAIGINWWNGESMWKALTRPPFNNFDVSFFAQYPKIFMVMGWMTVVHEMFYPIMVFTKFFRKYWVMVIISMHLCIGIFMGLYLFASIMIILNITAFLSKEVDYIFKKIAAFKSRMLILNGVKRIYYANLKHLNTAFRQMY